MLKVFHLVDERAEKEHAKDALDEMEEKECVSLPLKQEYI